MTLAAKLDAINLAQGFPQDARAAAVAEQAIDEGLLRHTQYTSLFGLAELREVLAERAAAAGLNYDPTTEITVTIGCTEAVAVALLAVAPAGSEVLTPEPFYDSYPGVARLAGARLVPVPMADRNGGFELDIEGIRRAVTPATRAILLNSPHNPTGYILSERAGAELARLAVEHDLYVVSDEVYEEHVYDGPHVRIAAYPGMRERTVVCSSASKMLAVGGWRVGWVLAPEAVSDAIQHHHRHLTFAVPTPLQAGVAGGLRWAGRTGYFADLRADYRHRRDVLSAALAEAGLAPRAAPGGFFVVADVAPWGATPSAMGPFAKRLIRRAGVAALPMGDFFAEPKQAGTLMRFAFCKPLPMLLEAARRLGEHGSSGGLAVEHD
ncbi:aminotransferase class I/II-fold pyridoxal phosphate-dependent enzyme [Microbispora sp. NPDC088329]|uniref:aminotransferase class I/II-fold pyridoxal phosphate-dependent enzyme n=1 Tax=Microbispora sp. NPDC088329 TaxID=3154869 RepID=UPI003436B7B6